MDSFKLYQQPLELASGIDESEKIDCFSLLDKFKIKAVFVVIGTLIRSLDHEE